MQAIQRQRLIESNLQRMPAAPVPAHRAGRIAHMLRAFGVPARAVRRANAKHHGGVLLTSRIAVFVPSDKHAEPCIVRLLAEGGVHAWPPRFTVAELYEDYRRALAFGLGVQ